MTSFVTYASPFCVSTPERVFIAGESLSYRVWDTLSSARAPLKTFSSPWFPSWHAYSKICISDSDIGIEVVKESENVVGSIIVYSYSSVSSLALENLSTNVSVSPVPIALEIEGLKLAVLSVKFVVSITSTSPSQ